MYACAGQRIEIGGHHRGERFSFAGMLLDQKSLVQSDGCHDLDIVGLQSERSLRRLAD
ncbi:hypothetical protein D1872_322880 [compost metagenome]